MKLLLTSAGIKNASINECAGRPAGQADRRLQRPCIPTAEYGHPKGGPGAGMAVHQRTGRQSHGRAGVEVRGSARAHRVAQHRRRSLGPWVRETDVLLVTGGDALYLCHWMRQSGLADLLPSLDDTVWVGLSAGSMVMTPRSGRTSSAGSRPPGATARWGSSTSRSSRTWIARACRSNTMADAERWAAGIAGPAYAIDDQTAIKVTDGTVEVVSEGHWKLFNP